MGASLLYVGLGMAASNYAWQVIGAGNFRTAFERTWFELAALAAAWVALRMRGVR